MKLLVAVLLCLALVWVTIPASAVSEGPVVVGQIYVLAVDCLPEGVGCFGEVVRVTKALEGGWIEAEPCLDERCAKQPAWKYNMGRVYAVRPHVLGTPAN